MVRLIVWHVALVWTGAFASLVAVALAQPAPGPRIEPASAITVQDGQLSVRVHDRPLQSVLEEISRKGKVAIIQDGGIGRRRVSVELRNLPVDEGLRQILRNHDAFFFYGVEGKAPASLRAVWVYPKGGGRALQPVPPEAWASTVELDGRLADPDAGVRARAVEALVERKGDQARDAVLDALKDQDDDVRTRALYQALGTGVKLPSDVLTDLALSDPSTSVRFLALEALAAGGGPEMRTIVETALNDPSPHIQRKAQEILRRLDAAPRPQRRSRPVQDR